MKDRCFPSISLILSIKSNIMLQFYIKCFFTERFNVHLASIAFKQRLKFNVLFVFFFFEAEILPILFFRTLTNKVRKQFIKLKYSVRYFKVLVYSQFFINTDNAINYIKIPSSNFYLIIAFNLAYDKMIVPRIKYIPKYIFLFWCRFFCSL